MASGIQKQKTLNRLSLEPLQRVEGDGGCWAQMGNQAVLGSAFDGVEAPLLRHISIPAARRTAPCFNTATRCDRIAC